ncbi:MAG: hypothetical protein KKH94_06300, partial [Candidatus Omnitrophica bacterium]|nr:hypothetical protein [Candidatus Omnitrophota bacterium]
RMVSAGWFSKEMIAYIFPSHEPIGLFHGGHWIADFIKSESEQKINLNVLAFDHALLLDLQLAHEIYEKLIWQHRSLIAPSDEAAQSEKYRVLRHLVALTCEAMRFLEYADQQDIIDEYFSFIKKHTTIDPDHRYIKFINALYDSYHNGDKFVVQVVLEFAIDDADIFESKISALLNDVSMDNLGVYYQSFIAELAKGVPAREDTLRDQAAFISSELAKAKNDQKQIAGALTEKKKTTSDLRQRIEIIKQQEVELKAEAIKDFNTLYTILQGRAIWKNTKGKEIACEKIIDVVQLFETEAKKSAAKRKGLVSGILPQIPGLVEKVRILSNALEKTTDAIEAALAASMRDLRGDTTARPPIAEIVKTQKDAIMAVRDFSQLHTVLAALPELFDIHGRAYVGEDMERIRADVKAIEKEENPGIVSALIQTLPQVSGLRTKINILKGIVKEEDVVEKVIPQKIAVKPQITPVEQQIQKQKGEIQAVTEKDFDALYAVLQGRRVWKDRKGGDVMRQQVIDSVKLFEADAKKPEKERQNLTLGLLPRIEGLSETVEALMKLLIQQVIKEEKLRAQETEQLLRTQRKEIEVVKDKDFPALYAVLGTRTEWKNAEGEDVPTTTVIDVIKIFENNAKLSKAERRNYSFGILPRIPGLAEETVKPLTERLILETDEKAGQIETFKNLVIAISTLDQYVDIQKRFKEFQAQYTFTPPEIAAVRDIESSLHNLHRMYKQRALKELTNEIKTASKDALMVIEEKFTALHEKLTFTEVDVNDIEEAIAARKQKLEQEKESALDAFKQQVEDAADAAALETIRQQINTAKDAHDLTGKEAVGLHDLIDAQLAIVEARDVAAAKKVALEKYARDVQAAMKPSVLAAVAERIKALETRYELNTDEVQALKTKVSAQETVIADLKKQAIK